MKNSLFVSLISLFVLAGLTVANNATAIVLPSVGPSFAGSGMTSGGSGSIWSNASKVSADDDSYATSSIGIADHSETLLATNFGFSIPADASINGIQISIGRKSSTDNISLKDRSVRLIKSGLTVGDNKNLSSHWSTSETSVNYGSMSDLWGTSWVPAQINASNFGVGLSVDNHNFFHSRTASVDYVKVTVYYTPVVLDTIAPVLSLPANITAEATGSSGRVVTFTATATDETAPANPVVSCTPSSGSMFGITTTTVNCSTTDTAGNTGTGSFNITIKDTTSPIVNVPTNVVFEAGTGGETIVTYSASAVDIVDGATTVVCLPASGSSFPIGTTTVTCNSTDTHSNTGTASFSVIVSDTTGPTLVLPSPIVEATGANGASVEYVATANDIVDGSVLVVCTPASGSVFPLGVTSVFCSASDTAEPANISIGSFNVTVRDTTAPIITLLGISPFTFMAHFNYTDSGATAFDVVDGNLTANIVTVNPVDYMNPGTYVVTYNVIDAAGNIATEVTRIVVVIPRRRPRIAPITESVIETPSFIAENFGGPVIIDESVVEPVIEETLAPVIPQVLGSETFQFTRDLKLGMKGDDVLELHKKLAALGFYSRAIDDLFGVKLEAAVKAFQKANPPLKVDGIVGPLTRAILNK